MAASDWKQRIKQSSKDFKTIFRKDGKIEIWDKLEKKQDQALKYFGGAAHLSRLLGDVVVDQTMSAKESVPQEAGMARKAVMPLPAPRGERPRAADVIRARVEPGYTPRSTHTAESLRASQQANSASLLARTPEEKEKAANLHDAAGRIHDDLGNASETTHHFTQASSLRASAALGGGQQGGTKTGPRGGQYYLSPSGAKVYIGSSADAQQHGNSSIKPGKRR
jgi:hypothetical protein